MVKQAGWLTDWPGNISFVFNLRIYFLFNSNQISTAFVLVDGVCAIFFVLSPVRSGYTSQTVVGVTAAALGICCCCCCYFFSSHIIAFHLNCALCTPIDVVDVAGGWKRTAKQKRNVCVSIVSWSKRMTTINWLWSCVLGCILYIYVDFQIKYLIWIAKSGNITFSHLIAGH